MLCSVEKLSCHRLSVQGLICTCTPFSKLYADICLLLDCKHSVHFPECQKHAHGLRRMTSQREEYIPISPHTQSLGLYHTTCQISTALGSDQFAHTVQQFRRHSADLSQASHHTLSHSSVICISPRHGEGVCVNLTHCGGTYLNDLYCRMVGNQGHLDRMLGKISLHKIRHSAANAHEHGILPELFG